MSASLEKAGDSHASGHSDHGGHGHHGPPPPPEPKTPLWLTAVGAVLFLIVGLAWGLSSPSESADAAAPQAEPAADAGAAAPSGH